MNEKKKDEYKEKYSPIGSHIQHKKILKSKIGNLDIKKMVWNKDLLPEYFWIDGLAQYYGFKIFHTPYFELLDRIKEYIEKDEYFLGLISDFGRIKESKRSEFLKNEKDIVELFQKTVGEILCYYPDCPANWLVTKKEKQNEEEFQLLVKAVERLHSRNDDYVGHLRTIIFSRLMSYGNIHVKQETWELISRYPKNVNKDERYHVQSLARMIPSMFFMQEFKMVQEKYEWPKHFWNHNFKLSPCMEIVYGKTDKDSKEELKEDSKEKTEQSVDTKIDLEKFKQIIKSNLDKLQKYLYKDLLKMEKNLYDPRKDDVVIGLFTRVKRLYEFIILNDKVWNLDTSNIILRCLTDTVFNLCYLVKQNDINLYQDFISYGEGKEKLLMLQLQDNYPDLISTGTENISKLESEIGESFFIEIMEMNFGNWTQKSIRDMALECGFKMEYSLIYNPASEDVHGSWYSVRKMNLFPCANILHGFHRLPQYRDPIQIINPHILSTRLMKKLINFCIDNYNFPKMKEELDDFSNLR